MRPALRGAIAATVAAGLVTSLVAVAVPAGATDPAPAATTLKLSVTHTPYLGLTCVVGATLRTSAGQVGGLPLTVQQFKDHKWVNLAPVKSRVTKPTRSELKTVYAVKFRAKFAGDATHAASTSKVVTCKPKSLSFGTRSSAVTKVQKKLKALRIRPASTSGAFDYNTLEAVYAFQKAKGIKRTGVVNASVYSRILATTKMRTPSWCDKATTMCVDLSQQVGYLQINSKRYVIPVSSGGGYYFFNPQSRATEFAHTPHGTFHVYYKVPGPTTGPLGTYYWISFFTGGYGIHGSASVPTYPASHGCVREPRTIEQWVYRHLPIGAQVKVHS